MPRTPVAASARLERISVRAMQSEVADLDLIRGAQSRSDFVRGLIRDAKARHHAIRKDPS